MCVLSLVQKILVCEVYGHFIKQVGKTFKVIEPLDGDVKKINFRFRCVTTWMF